MKKDWMRAIQPGDVLRFGNGDLRVVRAVSVGRHVFVTFAIRRCSWTGRCYTVMDAGCLKSRGVRPTGFRVSLRGKKDRAIEAAIKGNEFPSDRGGKKYSVECCDVADVP